MHVKYLGVTFYKRLTWKTHIKNITNKASQRTGIIKFMSNYKKGLNQQYLLTLYKSIVRPILEYASEVWGDTSNKNKLKLDSILHRSLTTALGVNRLAHKKDTNYEAKVLPLVYK